MPCRELLPDTRCALTAPFHPYLTNEAVYSLLHFPSAFTAQALPGTLPYEARTFLSCFSHGDLHSSDHPAVYYDLLEKRREQNLTNVAIVRIEQLYPYPEQRLAEILAAYPNVKELVWAQEEPKNQGAWLFIAPRLYDDILKSGKQIRISFAGREASAAPACGSPYLHAKQQAQLINDALAIEAEQSGDSQ